MDCNYALRRSGPSGSVDLGRSSNIIVENYKTDVGEV